MTSSKGLRLARLARLLKLHVTLDSENFCVQEVTIPIFLELLRGGKNTVTEKLPDKNT